MAGKEDEDPIITPFQLHQICLSRPRPITPYPMKSERNSTERAAFLPILCRKTPCTHDTPSFLFLISDIGEIMLPRVGPFAKDKETEQSENITKSRKEKRSKKHKLDISRQHVCCKNAKGKREKGNKVHLFNSPFCRLLPFFCSSCQSCTPLWQLSSACPRLELESTR